MFEVFAIDETLRYRGTRFPGSRTLCHPEHSQWSDSGPIKTGRVAQQGGADWQDWFLPKYVVNIHVFIVLYIVSAINGRFLLDFHHFCSLRVILATNLVSDLFYKFPFNIFSLILSCIIFFMSFSTQDQINYIWQQRHLCSSNQSKIWKYQLTAQHKLWKSKSAKSNVKREKC